MTNYTDLVLAARAVELHTLDAITATYIAAEGLERTVSRVQSTLATLNRAWNELTVPKKLPTDADDPNIDPIGLAVSEYRLSLVLEEASRFRRGLRSSWPPAVEALDGSSQVFLLRVEEALDTLVVSGQSALATLRVCERIHTGWLQIRRMRAASATVGTIFSHGDCARFLDELDASLYQAKFAVLAAIARRDEPGATQLLGMFQALLLVAPSAATLLDGQTFATLVGPRLDFWRKWETEACVRVARLGTRRPTDDPICSIPFEQEATLWTCEATSSEAIADCRQQWKAQMDEQGPLGHEDMSGIETIEFDLAAPGDTSRILQSTWDGMMAADLTAGDRRMCVYILRRKPCADGPLHEGDVAGSLKPDGWRDADNISQFRGALRERGETALGEGEEISPYLQVYESELGRIEGNVRKWNDRVEATIESTQETMIRPLPPFAPKRDIDLASGSAMMQEAFDAAAAFLQGTLTGIVKPSFQLGVFLSQLFLNPDLLSQYSYHLVRLLTTPQFYVNVVDEYADIFLSLLAVGDPQTQGEAFGRLLFDIWFAVLTGPVSSQIDFAGRTLLRGTLDAVLAARLVAGGAWLFDSASAEARQACIDTINAGLYDFLVATLGRPSAEIDAVMQIVGRANRLGRANFEYTPPRWFGEPPATEGPYDRQWPSIEVVLRERTSLFRVSVGSMDLGDGAVILWDPRGYSPNELQDRLGLAAPPHHWTQLSVPPGTSVRLGTARGRADSAPIADIRNWVGMKPDVILEMSGHLE